MTPFADALLLTQRFSRDAITKEDPDKPRRMRSKSQEGEGEDEPSPVYIDWERQSCAKCTLALNTWSKVIHATLMHVLHTRSLNLRFKVGSALRVSAGEGLS